MVYLKSAQMNDWKNETGDLRQDNNDAYFSSFLSFYFRLIKDFQMYTVGKIGYFEEVLRNICGEFL